MISDWTVLGLDEKDKKLFWDELHRNSPIHRKLIKNNLMVNGTEKIFSITPRKK